MTTPRHSARTMIVAVIAPLVIVLGTAAIMFSWVGSVPSPTAVHWDAAGRPDGAGSPVALPILLVVVGLSLTALLGGIVVVVGHRGPLTRMVKLTAALVPAVCALLAIDLAWGMGVQRGIASWHDAPSTTPGLYIAPIVAVLIGVAGWFIMPKAVKGWSRPTNPPSVPLTLTPTERASWHHDAAISAGLAWLSIGTIVVVVVASILGIASSGGNLWVLSLLPVVVLLLLIATSVWSIRVDDRGVLARSVLGLPRVSIPLSKVASAEVVQVDPFREFGGWGIRFGLNRDLGIVLRSGEALRVVRTSGRSLVITVDDAADAAALLGGLVERNASLTSKASDG